MHWAKARERSRFNLGGSGAPPPPVEEAAELLAFDGSVSLSSAGDCHGFPALRAAIAAFHGVGEESVLVSDGTSLANYAALAALAGPGERVLVEAPTYAVLAEIPRFHGAVVEPLARRPEDGWVPRLQEVRRALDAAGPRLRGVVLTRLHNPTGTNLPDDFLAELARLADAHDFHVLLDEVYLDFVDARPGHRFSPRFLSTGSLTKVYGFGGLRVGWVVGDPSALAPVKEVSFYLAVNASAPSQLAAIRILAARERFLARTRALAARGRDIVERWLSGRDDVSWVPPAGGLVGFVRLHRVEDTASFAARLLETTGVALAAGEHFGEPGWVRLGFGIEEEKLREALRHLGAALDERR
jgi:aspartate/methionine/tyrosine aminotransferase